MTATQFQQACGAATYEQGFEEGQADRRIGRRLAHAIANAGSDEWQMGYADGWDLCPEGDPS